jgi:hypothetical protein
MAVGRLDSLLYGNQQEIIRSFNSVINLGDQGVATGPVKHIQQDINPDESVPNLV